MINKNFNDFVHCHNGAFNRLIHVLGFLLIGVGIYQKSLFILFLGIAAQESGHFYQHYKTGNFRDSPLYCLKSQSIFAIPIYIIIITYVLFF